MAMRYVYEREGCRVGVKGGMEERAVMGEEVGGGGGEGQGRERARMV